MVGPFPGNLEHAVHSEAPSKLLFVFAADSYSEVHYLYLDEK